MKTLKWDSDNNTNRYVELKTVLIENQFVCSGLFFSSALFSYSCPFIAYCFCSLSFNQCVHLIQDLLATTLHLHIWYAQRNYFVVHVLHMTIQTYLYFIMKVVAAVKIMKATITSPQMRDNTATMKSRQSKKQKLSATEIKYLYSIEGTWMVIMEQW